MSILQIVSASKCRILHWFIHVVDNFNIKNHHYLQRITVSAN